jgi:Xaa-Pro dipeptidase
MSVPFYESLMSYVPGKFKVARDIVAELRTVKSAAEIVLMRHAAHLSDLGFETMLKVASPGMRGIEIVAEMERVIRREGADHAKYWMASGPPPDWAGVRLDVKPHLRILQEGDLMASCSYVCFRGYWCHGHRTGTLRKPCPDLTETCKIAREAQDAGLAKMSPGIPVGHVGRAVRQKAAEHGWAIMGGRFGHGIGLDYAERPSITEEESMVLQPGVTTVLHSMFALPGSGAFFVPLGDVCCVTENGPEFLMAFPRTPFVAGQ